MKNFFLYPPIYTMLCLSVLYTSCIGQVKDNGSIKKELALQKQKNGSPKLIKTQGSGKFDKQYETVSCGLRDKSGKLWFGTSREGVYCYDGKLFTQYTIKDGLSSNGISCMMEDKNGILWFGSKEGLCKYDGKTFTRIPIALSYGSIVTGFNKSNNNLLAQNEIWSMLQDKNGKLWFGTADGIYCYNGNFFTRFLEQDGIINKEKLKLKWTQGITEDKKGNIWFGSFILGAEGASCYDGKSIINYKPLGATWVRSIVEDKKGNLLFVTRNRGVCYFDGKNFTNITEKAGIDNTAINSMFEDKAGNLWFTTENGSGQLGEDGGLWRFDGNCEALLEANKKETTELRKRFTKYTTVNGLIHNGVFCLVEDSAGKLWIGTRNTGLCTFDGKTFVNYSE